MTPRGTWWVNPPSSLSVPFDSLTLGRASTLSGLCFLSHASWLCSMSAGLYPYTSSMPRRYDWRSLTSDSTVRASVNASKVGLIFSPFRSGWSLIDFFL